MKGFTNEFFFYQPKYDLKPTYEAIVSFLPEIKTHRHNIPLGTPSPNEKKYNQEVYLQKSLHIVGRNDSITKCIRILEDVFTKKDNQYISIRGIIGSGKSLFVRRVLYEFVDRNKELKNQLK